MRKGQDITNGNSRVKCLKRNGFSRALVLLVEDDNGTMTDVEGTCCREVTRLEVSKWEMGHRKIRPVCKRKDPWEKLGEPKEPQVCKPGGADRSSSGGGSEDISCSWT